MKTNTTSADLLQNGKHYSFIGFFVDACRTVKNFRSDLMIDREIIQKELEDKENDGYCIFYLRENGSHAIIATSKQRDSIPSHRESFPYLFGKTTRKGYLESQIQVVSMLENMSARVVAIKLPQKTIVNLSFVEAKQIIEEWIKSCN